MSSSDLLLDYDKLEKLDVSEPSEVRKLSNSVDYSLCSDKVVDKNMCMYLSSSKSLNVDKSDISQKCVSVKGRLKQNIQFWFDIKANDYILDTIVNGYKLPFQQIPQSVHLKNNKSSLENDEFVKEAIYELLLSGSVVESNVKPFVINPLTVAQNSTKKRLVLDLRHVNECLVIDHVKFEDWKVALQYTKLNNYMFSFDLKNGYHHIDIHNDFHKYLGFAWNFNGKIRYFYFTVLPFGLATAGHIFTKTVRCLVKHWRESGLKIIVFLDDGLACSETFELAVAQSERVKLDLHKSGFLENFKKSIWEPTRIITWLGVTIDLNEGILFITKSRVDSVIALIQSVLIRPRLTARKLARITGKIISMSLVLGNIASLMLRFSHVCIVERTCWDFYFVPNVKVMEELKFWYEHLSRLNVRPLENMSQIQRVVYSDASNTGCGGYVVNIQGSESFRSWKAGEESTSSTYRELLRVFTVLQSVPSALAGKKVKWFTDNQCVVSIVNKGSMKQHLHELALKIYKFAIKNAIDLYMEWIPRSLNERADLISRTVDRDDWQVSDTFFKFIDFAWGPHTFDRFADSNNKKTEKFNSKLWCPLTAGVDALAYDWRGENNWVVPPIFLVSRCINHMVNTGAVGTLVVPWWPSAMFWPLLMNSDSSFREFVTAFKKLDNARGVFVRGSVPSVFNSEFKGSVLALRINGQVK